MEITDISEGLYRGSPVFLIHRGCAVTVVKTGPITATDSFSETDQAFAEICRYAFRKRAEESKAQDHGPPRDPSKINETNPKGGPVHRLVGPALEVK